MEVKTIGMRFSVSGTKTLEDFLIYLKNEIITPTSDHRLLFIDRLESDLWAGCLLSFRDERVFLKYTFVNGVYKIDVEEIGSGEKIDCNFFIINSRTARGLLQLYHNSASFNIFAHLLKTKFGSMRAIESFTGSMEIKQLLRDETIDDWLNKITRIKRIDMDLDISDIGQKSLEVMGSEASRTKLRFSFRKTKKTQVSELKKAVGDFYRTEGKSIKRMVIVGESINTDDFYDITENIDIFHRQDYNDFAKSLEINSSDVATSMRNCANIQSLLSIYRIPSIKRHIG